MVLILFQRHWIFVKIKDIKEVCELQFKILNLDNRVGNAYPHVRIVAFSVVSFYQGDSLRQWNDFYGRVLLYYSIQEGFHANAVYDEDIRVDKLFYVFGG